MVYKMWTLPAIALLCAGCQSVDPTAYSLGLVPVTNGYSLPSAKQQHVEVFGEKNKSKIKLVSKYAKKHDVPVELALAVVQVESAYNPKARGGAGEVGLMQIMPRTARGMGYKGTIKALYTPEVNLDYGMQYLAKAHELADGKVCGTILRYNAGHYAKRMNPISSRYCQKVKGILKQL